MKSGTFSILTLLALSTIGLQTTLAQIVFEHGSGVISVEFSRDGMALASGAIDGTVKLWNVETHSNIATLDEHTEAVFSVDFSPNDMLLASGSFDGTVKLWNVETHSNIATLEGHATPIFSVAFSPDGTAVASGALNGIVKLWDVETHLNTSTFGGYDASILEEGGWLTPVSFLSNTTLAVGARDSIKLWDVVIEENIATFEVPGDPVVSVLFSPDGTTLATGLRSGIIKLWNVATRTNATSFPSLSTTLFPQPPFISFSPDGTLLASTVDENVVLWDLETETQINTLFGHTDAVVSVSFSLDGSLASGAADGTVRLWNAPSSQEASPRQEELVASTMFPLTEATLHGSVVTLTLNGHQFVDSEWNIIDALSVSGIDSVTVSSSYFGVNRISDRRVAVELEFNGTDFDSDATLTFTVGADAIVSHDQGLSVQVPVTAIQKSNATVSIVPSPVVTAAVGEQLTFSINIVSGENVTGYQAAVFFDPTALQPVDFTNGDYLPRDVFIADPDVDKNWIEGMSFDEGHWEESVTLAANTLVGAANGAGTLATLTFKGVDFKASTLTLSKVYLVDTAGKLWEAHIENGEITLPPEPAEKILGDINRDGVVNIQDLIIVGARYGQKGHNSADISGDGLVDIVDLVLVANAFGVAVAPPLLNPQALDQLTATDVKIWLNQARQLDMADPKFMRGVNILEQLHRTLTPKETTLLPNYPNPFNPETWIPYQLSRDAEVTLTIYDANGVMVRRLDLGHRSAGYYTERERAAYWDGCNDFGEKIASGVYFYHLAAGDFSAARKMVILK